MSKRARRIAKRSEAAQVLENHTGPVMSALAGVIHDLAEECEGLQQFEADAAYAAELSFRLDKMIQFGDPLAEALDGIVLFFVALGAVFIWRAVSRREGLRAARLDKLQDRLEKRGPKMAKAARMRLERRIKRLSS